MIPLCHATRHRSKTTASPSCLPPPAACHAADRHRAQHFPDCISAVGNVACPSTFPQQTLYYQNIADDRSCSTCNCVPQGQLCQVEIEVCSVGLYQVTINEGDDCTQLSSSDGDGVSLLSTNGVQQGTCSAVGGELQGSTAPIDPITVCCME